MKRTRAERAAAVAAKRPPGLVVRVETVSAPRQEDRDRLVRLLLELLDERAADGR